MTKIYDATVPLSSAVPTWPGDPRFKMVSVHRLADGDACNVARLTLGTHAGTHVDAPFHFLAEGSTVDQLPLELLMGKARVIGVSSSRDRVDRKDLEDLDLSDELRVLIRTRSSGLLRQGPFREDFVWLTADAAALLVQRGIKLVGIDSPSVDRFDSKEHETHRTLLGAGVIVVEALDLSAVEPGEYDLFCLPLRLVGGDGAPARVVLRTRP
jgi:arylformamidase